MQELTKDILSTGCTNDDLCADGGHPNLHTGVPVLGQLSGQQLIELSVENTVGHELRDSPRYWLSLKALAYCRKHELQDI